MSGAFPAISVVIPCYRHAAQLHRCLAGVVSQQAVEPFEVIVVDSAPDPAVAQVAGTAGARLVRATERLGPGEARNAGAREAHGDLLFFLDADCVPEPGWLAGGRAALESGARLAGGPVLDVRPFHPISASDNLLQFAEFPRGRPDGPATHFPGCNLAIRRADFIALGGFPPVGMAAGEDGAFSWLVRTHYPDGLRFTRAMTVRHDGRTGFADFLHHQRGFGYCRGALGLSLGPTHRRLGSLPLMTAPIAAKRLAYIIGRGVAWDAGQLARTALLLPVLLPGLIAWAIGFRHGLAAVRNRRT
jgi:GT2 family glycosyltransferase